MLMVFTGCAKFECEEPVGDSMTEKSMSISDQANGEPDTRGDDDGKPNDGITDDEDDEDDSQRSTNR